MVQSRPRRLGAAACSVRPCRRLERRRARGQVHDQGQSRSSAVAKKAEAAFKIELARRSSATSRLRRLISADSSLVIPGRSPWSTSARRTHWRTVSGVLTPQQFRDVGHRGPLRVVVATDLAHHPHRPLLQLRRVPLRRVPWHDSNLSNDRSLRTSRGGSAWGSARLRGPGREAPGVWAGSGWIPWRGTVRMAR
jgi:hypothetical protein